MKWGQKFSPIGASSKGGNPAAEEQLFGQIVVEILSKDLSHKIYYLDWFVFRDEDWSICDITVQALCSKE